jgi:cyclopropane-fatty-acyl-phospholipid synthase
MLFWSLGDSRSPPGMPLTPPLKLSLAMHRISSINGYSLFQTYRREVDFIQRYVFPGGMLPSPQVLKSLGERFGVPVIRERIFGQDYAKTLATWRNNFRAAWPNLMPLGFDDRFRRLWEYYLAYCEAGFLSGNIDVRQVVFAKSS